MVPSVPAGQSPIPPDTAPRPRVPLTPLLPQEGCCCASLLTGPMEMLRAGFSLLTGLVFFHFNTDYLQIRQVVTPGGKLPPTTAETGLMKVSEEN